MSFMECSSMTGLNILNLFDRITDQVVQVYQDTLMLPAPIEPLKLGWSNGTKDEGNKSVCCWK